MGRRVVCRWYSANNQALCSMQAASGGGRVGFFHRGTISNFQFPTGPRLNEVGGATGDWLSPFQPEIWYAVLA